MTSNELFNVSEHIDAMLNLLIDFLSNLQFTTWSTSLILMFVVYYFRSVVKRPSLHCRPGPLRSFVEDNVSILKEKMYPTPWLMGATIQTVVANMFREKSPMLKADREELTTSDGGLVSIDWYHDDRQSDSLSSNRPIALLIPGLTGDSQTEYLRTLVVEAQKSGFRAVGMNNRGRGGNKLLTPKFYCGACCADLTFVIDHIKEQNSEVPLVIVGVSLGGISTMRYLREQGSNSKVDAAVLISGQFDCVAGFASMSKWSNTILNYFLARTLVNILSEFSSVLKPLKHINYEHVLEARTIHQFEDRFQIKMWGFETVNDYYTECSAIGKLGLIKVPVIALTAADDMFVPISSVPFEEIESSDHIALVVTSRGGHIGFMDGLWPRLPFFSERFCGQVFDALVKLENIRKLM